MTLQTLCGAEEVTEGSARGFRFGTGSEQIRLFVIRKNGTLYAYHNRCPHVGTPLEWQPNRFFDRSGDFLVCSTHGALFRPEDGHCVAGPCTGKALRPLRLEIADGVIQVETG